MAVRQFLYGIGFQRPEDWDKVWREHCTAEDLFNTIESDEASPAAMVLAGYMRFCEYLRNVKEVLDNVEGLGILDRARLFQFKDRIRNIHAWRLDLSSEETATRFKHVQERVSKMIDEQLRLLGFADDVKRIQDLFESSLDLFYDRVPEPEPVPV
jgi:hypothetical protein